MYLHLIEPNRLVSNNIESIAMISYFKVLVSLDKYLSGFATMLNLIWSITLAIKLSRMKIYEVIEHESFQ
jgi:hypothetical protein